MYEYQQVRQLAVAAGWNIAPMTASMLVGRPGKLARSVRNPAFTGDGVCVEWLTSPSPMGRVVEAVVGSRDGLSVERIVLVSRDARVWSGVPLFELAVAVEETASQVNVADVELPVSDDVFAGPLLRRRLEVLGFDDVVAESDGRFVVNAAALERMVDVLVAGRGVA